MRRLILAATLIAALAGSAEALTIRDIIELTRAGLGEDVLLALIEVERGVYAIDTATLKQLKAAGVSNRVIVALVRSGREMPVAPIEPVPPASPINNDQAVNAPPPQVIVIEHHDHPTERIREVPVAVPVYIPVSTRRHRHVDSGTSDTSNTSTFVPFQSGSPVDRHVEPRKAEPVYWGFGGKLRPDAWDPGIKPPDRKK